MNHKSSAYGAGHLVVMAISAVITGCATPPDDPHAAFPPDLSIRLRGLFTDGRCTYLVLNPKGVLYFGGGRDALSRTAHPVRTLTAQETEETWQIIQEHNLLHTPPTPTATKPQKANWEIRLTANGHQQTIRCQDDAVSDLKSLHDKLFRIQSHERFYNP